MEQRSSRTAGEADAGDAEVFVQAMAHLSGQLDGYCISRGKNVSDDAIDTMIDIMDGYIIPPLRLLGVNLALKKRKSYSIFMMDSPYYSKAQQIVAEADEKGDRRIVPREELLNMFRGGMPNAKLIELEPKVPNFQIFSSATMDRLLKLAGNMVKEKLRHKPAGFWTALKFGDPRTNI